MLRRYAFDQAHPRPTLREQPGGRASDPSANTSDDNRLCHAHCHAPTTSPRLGRERGHWSLKGSDALQL
jgi:hypothetical protein